MVRLVVMPTSNCIAPSLLPALFSDPLSMMYPHPPHNPLITAISHVTELPSYGDSPAPISFRITGKVSEFPSQQVCHATSADDRPLVVKFTSTYSLELHQFCADRNRAPVPRGFGRLPGNIFGVAVDFVDHATHLYPSSTDERDKRRKQLVDLVKEFHSAGFVHGDL